MIRSMIFIKGVRSELAKVTWPTRRETVVTTVMVFVMVILASIYFLLVDQVLNFIIQLLIGLGR